MNWRWPERVPNGTSTYYPWFVLLWRLLWLVPMWGCLAMLLLCIALGRGPTAAKRLMREVW